MKTSGGGFVNIMTFFDDNYGGYWYTYVGGQIEGGMGMPSISTDYEKSILIGISHKNGRYGLKAFAGDFKFVVAAAGIKDGINIDVFAQFSVDKDWDVVEIGASAGFDLVPGADGSVSFGKGHAKLLDSEILTKNRPTWDRVSNQILNNPYIKSLYMPLAPFN